MANGADDRRQTLSDNLSDYSDRDITLVVSGSDEVYVGDKQVYTGGQYEMFPQYEDRYKASQEGFKAIMQDRNLYDSMAQAYNIFNNKPLNDNVAPDDLERFYSDANYEASKRDPSEKVTAIDVIFGRLPSGDVLQRVQQPSGGTRGSGAAYSGPQRTITEMAESDIKKSANTIALELLGRPVEQKEMDRIVRKMRRAERDQPTVTTSTPGQTISQQGLTAQGRDDILRDLISDNPEYEQFQVNTTVLDSMLGFVNRKKQVSGG